MPKGKPKAKNPGLYQEEDSEARQARQMAPQAAPHRRGGTHRVKEEHLTGTHWDDKNHQDLLYASKAAGLWKKDMPKWMMAQKLANKDRTDARDARKAERDTEKKKKEEEDRRRKEKEEKERAKIERERKRTAGEDVSTTTEELETFLPSNTGFGQLLSDEDDDMESTTTTTTTTHASLSTIYPAQKLRIYEWQYEYMPTRDPPPALLLPSGRLHEEVAELLPKKIPYAVMGVVTTETGERLELPGRGVPDEFGPDFVLSLPEHTKDCARNGILNDQLSKAVIERGSDWAARTQVQWWNGRMYFRLPPRKSKASLQDVYAKWKSKKALDSKMRRVKRAARIEKSEPNGKAQQRAKNRAEKLLDIYAASEYRPPICYVPSYLDYPWLEDDEEIEKSIDTLFYIRFRDMDLPHYYFWANPDEWDDPTRPNADWIETEAQEQSIRVKEQAGTRGPQGLVAARHDSERRDEKIRVKRTLAPRKFRLSATAPKSSKYKTALWNIERDLYHRGWANTMYVYRDKWLKEGKEHEWKRLICNLPDAYPSGHLPNAPPISANSSVPSLAEKFAAVDALNSQRPVQAIQGDEAWTRDDNAYWNVIDKPTTPIESNIQEHFLKTSTSPTEPQALHRRPSEVFAWMHNVSSPQFSTTTSSSTPALIPFSPTSPSSKRVAEREVWEELFLRNVEDETTLFTQIEQMPVAELKHNLYTLINSKQRRRWLDDHCAFCLKALDLFDSDAANAHYEAHCKDANDICPFCGMHWGGLESELKAAHVFFHDKYESRRRRRKPSATSSLLQALYAVPKTKSRGRTRIKEQETEGDEVPIPNRRMSKVKFSPVTVERRIAYNDLEDAGTEADVSSAATTLTRRKNLRKSSPRLEGTRKSALKIDTSTKLTKFAGARQSRGNGNHRKSYDQAPDLDHQEPSGPSTHVSSPELYIARRPRRHQRHRPDAAWDPSKYSTTGSEHGPSASLPHVRHHPPGHPNERWNPRRPSQVSTGSSKRGTGQQRSRERSAEESGTGTKAKSPAQTSKGRVKGKQKLGPQSNKNLFSGSRTLASTRCKRQSDPTYRDFPPSPPSSSSISPVLKKWHPPSDPTYRNETEVSSPSIISERPAKRRKTRSQRTKLREATQVLQEPVSTGENKHDLTASKISSTGISHKRNGLTRPVLDSSAKVKNGKKRKASDLELKSTVQKSSNAATPRTLRARPKLSTPSAKRKAPALETVSTRLSLRASFSSKKPRSSSHLCPKAQGEKRSRSAEGLSRRSSGQSIGDDFVPFVDEPHLENLSSDVLTGNPFAPPPKKRKTTKTTKVKNAASRTAKVTKSNTPSAKKLAPQVKKAVASVGAVRLSASELRIVTTSGHSSTDSPRRTARRRLSKRSRQLVSSATAEDLDTPTVSLASANQHTPSKDEYSNGDNHSRGHRSSAPTPSPSLGRLSRLSIDSPVSPSRETRRRTSYDVPFSDPRPIVPPNTPAAGLLSGRKTRIHQDGDSEMPLDADQLSDKIGEVKTTRRGLICEVLGGVQGSILEKMKPKRKSSRKGAGLAAKKTDQGEAAGSVTKIIVEKGIKVLLPAGRKRMGEVEKLQVSKAVEKGAESVAKNAKTRSAARIYARSASRETKKSINPTTRKIAKAKMATGGRRPVSKE